MASSAEQSPASRAFRLSEVTGRLREVLLPVTAKQFWVHAQLVPDKGRRGGNLYGSLVEVNAHGEEIARLRVTIWSSDLARIESVLKSRGADRVEVLWNGGEVLAWCSVRYHEVYGLSLVLFDVDPDLGESQIDRKRRLILESLQRDRLLEVNKQRPLTTIPLRIGLVTAADSAAYADFFQTLSASGFSFQVLHVPTTMQGPGTAASVTQAIQRLEREALDVICIVRGGGSPGDLAWLDDERIARAVVNCPLPVWVGIGHEIDFGVLDQIAHSAHKTPTAVAEALAGRIREVDNRLTAAAERLEETGHRIVDLTLQQLAVRENVLRQGARKHWEIGESRFGQKVGRIQAVMAQHAERWARRFEKASATLQERSRAILDLAEERLSAKLALVESLRPDRVFARGYSVTHTAAGEIVRSVRDVQPGTALVTKLADGTVTSRVEKIEERSDE